MNDTIWVVDERPIHIQLDLVFIAMWLEVVPVISTDLLRSCCISVCAEKDWPWDFMSMSCLHGSCSSTAMVAPDGHSHAALRSSSSMKPPGEPASLLSSE